MKLIGLTGGIASGKSTVASILRELGASVIDADAVYHELIAPRAGSPSDLSRAVGERFPGVLREDGSLDRKALGERVFADPQALNELNAITHPAVAQETARRIADLSARGVTTVVYDVPLLYERRLDAGMHGVIVVWVPREVQITRTMERDSLARKAAEKRLAAQMPLDDKRARATWLVDNSGSLDATRAQVERIWRGITSSAT